MTTATEFTVPDHGKIVHIYRNGDIFFSPKKFVVNKRNRSFDSFLNDVTAGLRPPFGAVRRLHTPVNGHKVSHLEEMVSGQRYVAVGNERFKRLGYESIPEGGIFKKPAGPITPREIKPVVHSRLKTSGRIRKIRNDPTTIFIYANGDILRNAVRVLFKKRELQSWDQTLSAIADRITLRTGAVRWLYTLDGTLVEDVGSLKNAEFYVGVGTERFYKELIPHYGQHPALQLSPRSERRKYLPPIIKPRRAKRKSNQTSENSGSLDNSLNSNKSKQRHKKTENEEDTVFHAKPVKHKRSSEKSRPVDYDKDEGGVYKAKQNNTETSGAAQVEESRDTRTELPIDQVPAEEVKDENETVNDNDNFTIPSDKSLTKRPSGDSKEDVDENENKRKSKDHNSPVPDNKTSNNEPDNELENKNSTPNAKSPTDQPEADKKSSTPANEDLNDVIEQHAAGDNQTNDKRSSTPDQAKPDPATGTGDAPPQETSKDEAVEEEKNPAKEEDAAASKIQAGVRGYQTRKKVKQKRKEETAAVKIQANIRGHQSRVKVQQKRENENAAATTIQAGYRGYQTRRDLKQNDSTADPEEVTDRGHLSPSDLDDSDQQQATGSVTLSQDGDSQVLENDNEVSNEPLTDSHLESSPLVEDNTPVEEKNTLETKNDETDVGNDNDTTNRDSDHENEIDPADKPKESEAVVCNDENDPDNLNHSGSIENQSVNPDNKENQPDTSDSVTDQHDEVENDTGGHADSSTEQNNTTDSNNQNDDNVNNSNDQSLNPDDSVTTSAENASYIR